MERGQAQKAGSFLATNSLEAGRVPAGPFLFPCHPMDPDMNPFFRDKQVLSTSPLVPPFLFLTPSPMERKREIPGWTLSPGKAETSPVTKSAPAVGHRKRPSRK